MSIVIIGGGLAGISAAFYLNLAGETNFVVYEKESEVGGIARSIVTEDGFTFDYASHILFTKPCPYAIVPHAGICTGPVG